MAKKRKCRFNKKERMDHERAVSLRKMPDKQLVEHFDRQYKIGYDAGRASAPAPADEILKRIAGIKGIGPAMFSKIQAELEKSADHVEVEK